MFKEQGHGEEWYPILAIPMDFPYPTVDIQRCNGVPQPPWVIPRSLSDASKCSRSVSRHASHALATIDSIVTAFELPLHPGVAVAD